MFHQTDKSTHLTTKANWENVYSDNAVEDIITAFEGVDASIISGWFASISEEPVNP